MKKLLNLILICTFVSPSISRGGESNEYQKSFFDSVNVGMEFDPVKTLNSPRNEIEYQVLSVFKSSEDEKFLNFKLKEMGKFPKNFRAKYDEKTIVIEFLNKKMSISKIDLSNNTFMLGETKIDLGNVKNLKDLHKVFTAIENPFVSSLQFNPASLFINEAHALGPLAIGFIAFALTSAAIATAAQMKVNLDKLERTIEDAQGICFALDYGSDFTDNAALAKFERLSRGIYNRASNGEKKRVRQISSCKQVKESWWEWAKSWFYSIFSMSRDDIRDQIVKLCEKSVKVDNCIKRYKNRGRVNNSNRDPSDPRFNVYENESGTRTSGSTRE